MDTHRKICNDTKKSLYSIVKDSNILLDLCCGRGGDILKWHHSNIKKVIAIDNHHESIKEAINRYKKCKINTKVSFYTNDVANINFRKYTKTKVNCVSIQFALHYFKDLDNLIKNISNIIITGGYFIGTCADGDIISNCINNNIIIKDVHMNICDNDNGDYSFKIINNTNNNDYFTFRNFESIEYYVFKDVLINICKKYNLVLDNIGNLKHNWGGNHISELYFSFIFKKL